MTLKQLIDKISDLALSQKCIHYTAAGTSIYQINPKTIKDYPILFQSPTGEHTVEDNTTTFEITLYYLDRLLEDNSNDIIVYSAAIEQLKNLARGIETIDNVLKVGDGYTITNVADTESFNDRLAGAYTTVEITVKNNETCYEE